MKKDTQARKNSVLTLISKLQPTAVKMDGKIIYNLSVADGSYIVGSGDTVWEAMKNFHDNFYGE